jgi:hypothetical protein
MKDFVITGGGEVNENTEGCYKCPFVLSSIMGALAERIPQVPDSEGIITGIPQRPLFRYLAEEKYNFPAVRWMEQHPFKVHILNPIPEKVLLPDQSVDYLIWSLAPPFPLHLYRYLSEIHRLLKNKGVFILGFFDAQVMQSQTNGPLQLVHFLPKTLYSTEGLITDLLDSGFQDFSIQQTLFGNLATVHEVHRTVPGYGKGAYVVISAHRYSK